MKDLFGIAIDERTLPAPRDHKRRNTRPNGYAARPGTGPAGETCGTCEHFCWSHPGGRRHYLKCGLVRKNWTHGPGTDILKRSPACELWKSKTS